MARRHFMAGSACPRVREKNQEPQKKPRRRGERSGRSRGDLRAGRDSETLRGQQADGFEGRTEPGDLCELSPSEVLKLVPRPLRVDLVRAHALPLRASEAIRATGSCSPGSNSFRMASRAERSRAFSSSISTKLATL